MLCSRNSSGSGPANGPIAARMPAIGRGGKPVAFRDIRGQEPAVLLLQTALSRARLAQAYLFYGPNGIGKKLTALQFAKALACQQRSADACESCPACRKIATGNHPDVVCVSPEGTSIRIEHIRAIQRQLSYKPYESQRTVIIIDGCECLTAPAANALLKTLEEPPATGLLLLITSKKDALPITILSRCQQIPFRRLAPEHIQCLLEQQGINKATARLVATLTEGSLSIETEAEVTHMLTRRQQAYTLFQEQGKPPTTPLFLQARQLANTREQCDEMLHWLTLFCRDLVMLHVAPHMPLYNQDLRQELHTLAQRLSIECLLQLFASLQQLRGYLTMNVNVQLALEHILLQLQQALEGT